MSMFDMNSSRENSNKLKEETFRNATDKTGKKMMNPLKLPEIFTYFENGGGKEKKWAAPNADITDYFNYGFTEDTFKAFSCKVKALFNKLQKTGGAHFKQGGDSEKFFEDKLPISHGGLEIMDEKALKDYTENNEFLSYTSDVFLDQVFTAQEHTGLDAIRKGIYEINNTVPNVYGLKKEPPPNPPSHILQPPPVIPSTFTHAQARPQPPGLPPHRINPPPMNMPGMYQPPLPHHPMEYQAFPPMMGQRAAPPYMGFPQKPDYFNPMFPHPMMPGGRPPMEMVTEEMEERKYEKKRKEEESEESDQSSDEREKAKSQSKSERRKKSRSKERKHRRSDKDDGHSESRHHHRDKERYDREDKGSRRGDKMTSKERERDEAKHDGHKSYSSHKEESEHGKSHGVKERRDWHKGFINNYLGSDKGRDKKDKRK